nr:TetR/AcrR family transcriptional regulator [Actinomycetota bacterium]
MPIPTTTATDIADFRHGRVPREVRRRQMLDLAEELFAERGYTAASMDELARRAGVSKPVVYDVFGSKEQVFRACMTRLADELAAGVQEAVAGAGDQRGRLRAGALAWFRFVADHRRTWEALLAGDD